MTKPYKGWKLRKLSSAGNPTFYYAQRDYGLILEWDETPHFLHPFEVVRFIDSLAPVAPDKSALSPAESTEGADK